MDCRAISIKINDQIKTEGAILLPFCNEIGHTRCVTGRVPFGRKSHTPTYKPTDSGLGKDRGYCSGHRGFVFTPSLVPRLPLLLLLFYIGNLSFIHTPSPSPLGSWTTLTRPNPRRPSYPSGILKSQLQEIGKTKTMSFLLLV